MIKKILRSLFEISGCQRILRRLAGFAVAQKKVGDLASQIRFCDELRLQCAQRLGLGTGAHFDASGEGGALQFVAKQLPAAAVVFDVGANQGDYTLLLAKLMPEATILSFEPSSRTFAMLQEKVKDLKQIRSFHLGLSNSEVEINLYSNQDGSGLASVHQRRLDHFGIAFDQSETVRMRTLDGFCDEQKIDRIDFLKLDVEGHELEVLKGAAARLESDRIAVIQFEFGGCNIDSRTFFQDFYYLLSERYFLYRILPEGLSRVEQYRESDEVFITTNYLAFGKRQFPALQNTSLYYFSEAVSG